MEHFEAERVCLLGDVHGQWERACALLSRAGLIDEDAIEVGRALHHIWNHE